MSFVKTQRIIPVPNKYDTSSGEEDDYDIEVACTTSSTIKK